MEDIDLREVFVTDEVLGKGAFGEVRIARWRNIPVAYKRSHTPMEDATNGEQDNVLQEIAVLSKLRHPNLVLFMGACKDPETSQLAIVTELLPCSLYDLLEVQKVELSLPDILDISLDIANGLDYLHRNEPCIVHRDISAKNILIGGNRVKIADLGQAKLFHQSVQSRQTGIPGAMAYCAPETLTGKYSSKIDIFSFGILLCQMCTGQYPRIDKREEQITSARTKHEILGNLIPTLVSFQPLERPDAKIIGEQLLRIKENDRYYPLSRRCTPEKDVGIQALHWMHHEISKQTSQLSLNLDQTQKLLLAEEQRWKVEASKVDKLQSLMEELLNKNAQLKETLQITKDRNQVLTEQYHQSASSNEDIKAQLKYLSNELDKLHGKQQSIEGKLASKSMELEEAKSALALAEASLAQQDNTLRNVSNAEEQQIQKNEILQRQLKMQVDYARELEARLDQTLVRWKEDKDKLLAETAKSSKLNNQCSQLLSSKQKMENDLQSIERRLQRYEGLPVPEEIKARFEDLTKDNESLRLRYLTVEQEKGDLLDGKSMMESDLMERDRWLADLKQSMASKESLLDLKTVEIDGLKMENERLQKDVCSKEMKLQELQMDMETLRSQVTSSTATIEKMQIELALERRSHNLLKEKVKNGKTSVGVEEIQAAEEEQNKALAASTAMLDELPPGVERSSEIAVKHLIERTRGRNGVEGLIELIQTHKHDERVLWRAARALRELLVHDEDSRKASQESRPETWAIELLSLYSESGILQAQAARLIGALSFGNDTFRRKAGERDVMRLLIKSMQLHSDDEGVLIHACTAITNLCHGSNENRSRFLEDGGVPVLIDLMRKKIDSAKIQCQACWVILTLCATNELAGFIVQHGGDLAVIKALLTHIEDGGVQQYGCWALQNLCLASEDIADSLRKKGAMEVCRITIENFPNEPEIMKQAMSTLNILVSGDTAASANKSPLPGGGGGGLASSSSQPIIGLGTGKTKRKQPAAGLNRTLS